MTTRETLTGEGFFFFMFTRPEARTEFMVRNAATFEFREFTETHCHQHFEVHFLAVRRLHHVKVVFTRAEGV